MARRGKVKYKDVVKKPHMAQKRNQKKVKPRKTYSLYANTKNNVQKRKLVPQKNSYEPAKKLLKEQEKEEEEYVSSEEEQVADLDNLLNTFSDKNKDKKSLAIDSSSDSESEDINVSDNIHLDSNEQEKLSNDDSIESVENVTTENNGELNKVESDLEDNPENIAVEADDSIEELNDNTDPFNKHVLYDLHYSVLDSLQNSPVDSNNYTETWPILGQLQIQIPKSDIQTEDKKECTVLEKKVFAPKCFIPKNIIGTDLKNLHIKASIIKNLSNSNSNQFTPLQEEIFSVINNYQDLYYPERNVNNADEIRYIYCLHAVNHVLKTRLKVIHHNARLTKKDDVPEEFRDQGLVRPKVLIILPFKDAAYKTVQTIINFILVEDKGNVMNKNRFVEDYTGNELFFPKKNPKPEDYEQLFQGNTSDDFKIGITVTKKSIKLYADFYSSDIILASPLGLRTIVGAEGEPERDFDFLASIELLIMDQTEIFLMQNWDHVIHTFNHLHLQPKDSHGTDFSRVRTWSLNGWAKYYRQTLIFSSINLPEINGIFNKRCQNYAGKVKVVNPIEYGCISQVVIQIPHVFQQFECKNAADAIDVRFDVFVNKLLPQHRENLMKQTLIYIPSYFDFVRVRNYFKKEDIGFVQICEYSKEGKVARARDMFYHGDANFLLYTERFHFFHRKRIKGINHIIFYQLPTFPNFYYELCNLMQEGNLNKKLGNVSNMSVTVLYSKYDIYQLSNIVSTEKCLKMVRSDRKVHMMVTGSE